KDCGLEERAPMCGVPHHAADTYIARLIEKGYKVAVCEQVEDPKTAKGIVRREVIRVVTPGTMIAQEELDETRNNYLMCVFRTGDDFGLSAADISTGECLLSETDSIGKLIDEIQKFRPSEILCSQSLLLSGIFSDDLKERLGFTLSVLEDRCFEETACEDILKKHFRVSSMKALGLDVFSSGRIAAGAMFGYLYETQKTDLAQMVRIIPYFSDRFMVLDYTTRRNLELTETMREKQKKGSLLWVLDKTRTAMGARLLRKYLEQPLIRAEDIRARHEAVGELLDHPMIRDEIREYLQPVYDLERLASRIVYQNANPRDLLAFRTSLDMLPFIRQLLSDASCPLLNRLYEEIDEMQDVRQWIADALQDDPPLAMHDGGILRDGYDEKVDSYRLAKKEGRSWLAAMEEEEREKTGIRTLRIKYNKIFGYCIEVTNSFKDKVPDYYSRRQTLAGSERYTTDRLKNVEEQILGAEDKLNALEYRLYCELRERVAQQIARIQKTARSVAELDVFCSFSWVAGRNRYVRPVIRDKGSIRIRGGRHPVIEAMDRSELFVENDTMLDQRDHRVLVITGPNMAGKSTYMRQSALIVLMAQIGSFVPASSAEIGIVDRIFTRVGASDDLSSGQSTFMLEMQEVAHILKNATPKSLLILDEIGRGTSTFDGLSIAWAVIEHIADTRKLGAKTLFATHYHELTELEGKLAGVKNYCIAVKEKGDDIVFLRKIIKGGADKSYGIQVAKLAGVPDMVTDRAKEIVKSLVDNDISEKIQEIAIDTKDEKIKKVSYDEVDLGQISLFDTSTDEDVLNELKEMDLESLRPIDALNRLYKLQNMLKNRW
ncbi:MAG: DNA mismatch repair protein MutS, partial [Eubacterium sp.]|nr:DNA mismatch repair protein MutS [Eubacterium sp.]